MNRGKEKNEVFWAQVVNEMERWCIDETHAICWEEKEIQKRNILLQNLPIL